MLRATARATLSRLVVSSGEAGTALHGSSDVRPSGPADVMVALSDVGGVHDIGPGARCTMTVGVETLATTWLQRRSIVALSSSSSARTRSTMGTRRVVTDLDRRRTTPSRSRVTWTAPHPP